MFTKAISTLLVALSALQHTALAAPANVTIEARGLGPIDLPEGKDVAVSFSCNGQADWSATKDTVAAGTCIKIPNGGAADAEFSYDTSVYASVSLGFYVRDDCEQLDYGWFKNIWYAYRGNTFTYLRGACIGSTDKWVEDGDYPKWNSFQIAYKKAEDMY
ncbi:uncharacterized protein K452DRAFT_309274 [Neofusicoccum parvum]|nr:uncharacterized protein K452DRAFT_309274 [Neofusicoccum parvum]